MGLLGPYAVADLHSKILDVPPPPPPSSNSFNFMQFGGQFGKIVYWRFPGGLAPPYQGNPGSATATHINELIHGAVSLSDNKTGSDICGFFIDNIGGSKGAPGTRAPWGPNSFIFMQSAKNLQSNPNLGVGAPIWGKSWIRHC